MIHFLPLTIATIQTTGTPLFQDGKPNIIAILVLAAGMGLSYFMRRR